MRRGLIIRNIDFKENLKFVIIEINMLTKLL
jgi:hypothetical protein